VLFVLSFLAESIVSVAIFISFQGPIIFLIFLQVSLLIASLTSPSCVFSSFLSSLYF